MHRGKYGSLAAFEFEHYSLLIKSVAEFLFLLSELDFQIETLDLIE